MDIEHERRLTECEARVKSNSHRLDEVERRQDNLEELTSAVNVLAVREESVEKNVEEIKKDVKDLTNKPAKRWDDLVDKIIMIVTAALVGFVLAKIGL